MSTPILNAAELPTPRIERVHNALVVPVQKGGRMPSGVFRANGTFCDQSRTLLSQSRFTDIPARPDRKGLMRLSGRHVFGGVARDHFGHFLLETVGRLWVFDHLKDPVDSVLFSPRRSGAHMAFFNAKYEPLFDALSDDAAPLMVSEAVVVEELLVPSQGFGHQAWITGTSQFRHFMRSRIETNFKPKGAKYIYVSRTRLKGDEKLVDKEARIERVMRRAGYEIFHPQEHDIETQIAQYRAAQRIVGPDGSAFHIAACVAHPSAKIGLIQRRHRDNVVLSFLDQFTAFGLHDFHLLNALFPKDDPRLLESDGPAPINFRRLTRQLETAGFI